MTLTHPKIITLQTGVPDYCYEQETIADFYVRLLGKSGAKRERAIRTVLNYAGVESRYSAVDPAYFDAPKTTKERNNLYMEAAVVLGERVIRAGLEQAGVEASAITSFVVVSCTGFNVPGLDLILAAKLGMNHSLSRTCVFGMGCYGAFPGLRRAMDSIKVEPGGLALVLALELCTLHLQFDESVESVVSTSLFADGAGMALISGEDSPIPGAKLIDAETYCDYQTMDHMSFTVTDQGFRMYLSSYVPDVLAANVSEFVERLLGRNNLRTEDVKFWAIHPGSKKIVEYIQQELHLSDAQVRASLETLRDYGNMSSATVLFVLDRINQTEAPQPGDYGVMMAFGPGLTMESMLVKW